jgi:hypothetical protein
LGYEENDARELDARLNGPAVKWFSEAPIATRTSWSIFKAQFLYQFGGGRQPEKFAIAELEKFEQGNTPMREFGPKLVQLIHQSGVTGAALQLDYFLDRVNPSLRQDLAIRDLRSLQEAVNIATAIEYNESKGTLTVSGSLPLPLPPTVPQGISGPTAMEDVIKNSRFGSVRYTRSQDGIPVNQLHFRRKVEHWDHHR